MDRRTFLKAGFSASATLSISPLVKGEEAENSFDVIVVGAGIAGLTAAALISKHSELRVLLLEKEPLIGGSSILSGGQWAVAHTDIQKSKGINDSEEIFFADMLKVGKYQNNPHIVSAFVKASYEQFQWIRSNNISPKSLALSAGMSKPRAHIFDPYEIISFLYRKCLDQGVVIRSSSPVTSLVMKDNQISGLLARKPDGQVKFYESRNVLLATGGFARSEELLEEFLHSKDGLLCFSGRGSTGDGLNMALALGADLADMDNIKPSFGFIENARGTKEMTGIFYSGAIAVNQNARRFVNESLPNKEIGQIAQKQRAVYLIFDENIRQLQMATRPNDKLLLSWGNLSKKVFFKGNSFGELASKVNLNPEELSRTVNRYNKCIRESKPDEFGRSTLSGGWGSPLCIAQKPYFIMKVCSGITGTYGGLKVDSSMRVISKIGRPIHGLFAAGEVCGGFHGDGFMAGTAFGKANACGRIAALSILEKLSL